jgi:magnesium chelatase family protein
MITKLYTATTLGLDAQLIEVEVDLSPALPTIIVVGLPDKAVQESKERVRSSIKQSGFEFPLGKITINLAPADITKAGSGFDLPMALGILHVAGFLEKPLPKNALFIGELSLDGGLRPVNGVLSICLWAKQNRFTDIYIPFENANEASLVQGINIYGAKNILEITNHLKNIQLLEPAQPYNYQSKLEESTTIVDGLYPNDMAYVRGQAVAKRALEVAASGGHNVLFIGSPGSGKTLLARSYPTILPKMTEKEILEATQIYSVAGMLRDGEIITKRPFRSPHHTSSHISLVGGGSKIRPGEISLAHRGVLFLDEFPEFSRETIEVLRQPLEDGFVTISRASGTLTYPSKFSLLAAANPTPSGFDTNDIQSINKPQNKSAISRYQAKFSGPILDRIDIQVEVNQPKKEEIQSNILSEKSTEIAFRVQKARDIQTKRFEIETISTNSEMTLPMIQIYCKLDEDGKKLLDTAMDKFALSARSYMRILKLSRTIADLEASENIQSSHIAESLQYRGKWG